MRTTYLLLLLMFGEWFLGVAVNISLVLEAANRTIPRGDYEIQALRLLKHWNSRHSTGEYSRKGILCTTIIRWNDLDKTYFKSNVLHSVNYCRTWMVLVYEAYGKQENVITHQIMTDLQELMRQKNMTNHPEIMVRIVPPKQASLPLFRDICISYMKSHFRHLFYSYKKPIEIMNPCDMINEQQSMDIFYDRLYSKGAMFALLLNDLQEYQYFWLLDSDIQLEEFPFCKYWEIIHCVFQLPPLVSQPLIKPSTQFYSYLNRAHWDAHMKNLTSPYIASEGSFVEIQAPFIKAKFFEWFIVSFLMPAIPMLQIMGSAWGIDFLFCSAAEVYMKHMLQLSVLPNKPCGIAIDDIALLHMNTITIRRHAGNNSQKINFGAVALWEKMFPRLSAKDASDRFISPLNVTLIGKYKQLTSFSHRLVPNSAFDRQYASFGNASLKADGEMFQCPMTCLLPMKESV